MSLHVDERASPSGEALFEHLFDRANADPSPALGEVLRQLRTSRHMQERALVNQDGGGKHGSAIRLAIRIWMWRASLLACALSFLVSARAWADSRVVVRAFKGPKGQEVRTAVVNELKDIGFEVVANTEVDRVARARGVRADESPGRGEVGRELTIHAWIDGRVTRTGNELNMVISVQNWNGEYLAELTATRRQSAQLVTAVRRDFWKVAGPAIEKAQAPEPPTPADSAEWQELAPQNGAVAIVPQPALLPSNPERPADFNIKLESPRPDERSAQAETKEGKKTRELSFFEAALSLNTLTRTLRFRNAFAKGVSDYELAAAPLVIGSARLYPGAFTRAAIACCIGIDGTVQRSFGLKSQTAEGVTYKTKFEGSTGSLVGRVPFAGHEINLLVGYGLQRFLIKGAPGSAPPVPSVEYRHIRVGGGGRFALGSRAKLGFDASWLVILDTGPLGSAPWFPRSTGGGLEGSFQLDVRLVGGLAARARASYQRSVFAFAPQQSNQRSESGAVDTYITAGFGFSYAY